MALLKNLDTGKSITKFVSIKSSQELTRSVHQLLDGNQYIQIIGNPAVVYEIVAYVKTAEKGELMKAEAAANQMQVKVKSGTYLGRIIELKFSERLAGDWWEATAVMAKG